MITEEKPCLVQAKQGFSVSYRNRFLYSKYEPQKNIINLVNNLELLEGTIFLVFSPCLFYGINELQNKLKENCLIIACEKDELLYDFSNVNKIEGAENIRYFGNSEIQKLPQYIHELTKSGKYKRAIRIDFSTGTQFYQDFYFTLEENCKNIIQTFWKNRITLIKFGRKYCTNFFKNLHQLPETTPIQKYFNSVEKPILVFGAGESIDSFLENHNYNFSDFFVLCADTALRPLLDRNIKVDGVFIEEAQSVILKAFIGCRAKKIDYQIFAGLSAASQLTSLFPLENISFFTTQFTDLNFFNKLKENKCLPPENPPFGSVGLTSVYYALKFRKNENVPIYICGLDFSFSVGKTHAKSTLASILRLQNTTRINHIQNISSAFSYGNIYEQGKDEKPIVSSPTLISYAQSFNAIFANEKKLFDCSDFGVKLEIERKVPKEICAAGKISAAVDGELNSRDGRINSCSGETNSRGGGETNSCSTNKTNSHGVGEQNFHTGAQKSPFPLPDYSKISSLLNDEKSELKKLLSLFTEESDLPKEELKLLIEKIASQKDYLYLYFPDGYSFNCSQSFLNRVRTQIDFFLKVL